MHIGFSFKVLNISDESYIKLSKVWNVYYLRIYLTFIFLQLFFCCFFRILFTLDVYRVFENIRVFCWRKLFYLEIPGTLVIWSKLNMLYRRLEIWLFHEKNWRRIGTFIKNSKRFLASPLRLMIPRVCFSLEELKHMQKKRNKINKIYQKNRVYFKIISLTREQRLKS